jgi:hypothetical protein
MDALKIDCTLHGLRHTHVSQLIAAGLDVLTISRRIGHASPAITLNRTTRTCSQIPTHAPLRSWRRPSLMFEARNRNELATVSVAIRWQQILGQGLSI